MDRRAMLLGSLATVAAASARRARAAVPLPYSFDLDPPTSGRAAFVAWMQKNRGEDAAFLGQRWDRYLTLIDNRDLWEDRNKRAFLLTPREEFVTKPNLAQAYAPHYLPIGYGVSITGPLTVARMTSSLEVKDWKTVVDYDPTSLMVTGVIPSDHCMVRATLVIP